MIVAMLLTLYSLIYILAILGISAVLLILLSGRHAKDQLWFIVFSITLMLWIVFQFAAQLLHHHNYASLYLIRLSIGIVSLLAVSFYIFIKQYLRLSSNNKIAKILFGISIVLFLISPTSIIIQKASSSISGIVINTIGPLYPLVLIFDGALVLVCIFRLIVNMRNSRKNNEERMAGRLLFYGVSQFALVIFFASIFLSNNSYAQLLVPISSFMLVAFISYGIIKHGLFNVRVIVARSIAYTLSVLAIVVLYTVVAFGVARYVFNFKITLEQEILFAFFSAFIALIFQPLKSFFDKFSNRLFYRDAYNGQEFLNTINSNIVNKTDLYNLLNSTAETVVKNIKVKFCSFYIDQKASIDFHTVGTDIKLFARPEWDSLAILLNKDDTKIFDGYSEESTKINVLMRKLGVETLFKMISQDQGVGFLVVGSKLSGNAYSEQDYQMLEIIADEVAIAVQNNLRFEEIAKFNITLQKKVDDATGELKKTNQKLRDLDEAKDEFISMASHQLRTPLTSVKGYISMLLDNDAGKVTSHQKVFLNQAYLSSQRMVYLISDLLNVSRLKTGKFVIESGPSYLPDVVEGELSQLTETAKARGLEIIFDKPKEFPILNLDETKTRQVIMNFADNAIYYTPKGGRITVKLIATKDTVEFTVNDTGIGVPKSEQHHLFTKFYRAGNARKARPDGTGLGLFMAKKVIIAEGGAIIFKAVEGKGSTFGFSFPRARLELKAKPPAKKDTALVS